MKRNKKLDILRIIAILMVFYNHKDAYTWYMNYSGSYNPMFIILSFLAILSKSGAPLFLMISGSLLLNKKEDISTVYKKRLPRMLIILFWISISMAVFKMTSSFWQAIFVSANWYIYSYIGYLIMLPLLRFIAQAFNRDTAKYYLILVTIFYSLSAFLVPRGITVSWLSYLPIITNPIWPSYCWNIVFPLCGFIVYHILQDNAVSDRNVNFLTGGGTTIVLALLGILSLTLTSINMFYDIQHNNGGNVEIIIQYSTFIPTCIIFYFAVHHAEPKNTRDHSLLRVLSNNTFGLYIIEISTPLSPIYINGLVLRNECLRGSYWYCIVAIIIQFVLYNLLISALRLIKPINKII